MGLFDKSQIDAINQAAIKSRAALAPPPKVKSKSLQSDLDAITKDVLEYFKDSHAILISDIEQLHSYIDSIIECGYAGIDTETTGLDRFKDYLVGVSLYYPGGNECYIPIKHRVPIFEDLYKGQLTYEQVATEFQRIVDSDVRLIFANADFDLSVIYKDLNIDFCDRCYYDVILAWRCLKEDELHNDLKSLYHKYVLKGKGDSRRFSDLFTPAQFPYVKPDVAKLYAANDAKITYELFRWQLPYTIKSHPKCQRAHLEAISDIIWGLEFPMIKVCQKMHRTGVYIDTDVATTLQTRYKRMYEAELSKLRSMVQDLINNCTRPLPMKRPFTSGAEFNPTSPLHTKFLLCDILGVLDNKSGTGKDVLAELNLPVTKQILNVRSVSVLINTFVDKLPATVQPDGKIHASFKQLGASTGRMSSEAPNLQNIPSHATDIRHMFRATAAKKFTTKELSPLEDSIQFKLSKFDSLLLVDGSRKRVEELIPGDQVVAKNNKAAGALEYVSSIPLERDTTTWICNFVEVGGVID